MARVRKKDATPVPTVLLTAESPYTRRNWPRGDAKIDGDDIVLVRQTDAYDPLQEPEIIRALANVETPLQAMKFVQRFGLLHAPKAGEHRQPLMEFFHASEWIRKLVFVETHLSRATQVFKAGIDVKEIRAGGVVELRRWFATNSPSPLAYRVAIEAGALGQDDVVVAQLFGLNQPHDAASAVPLMPNPQEPDDNTFNWTVANWLTVALSTTGLQRLRLWAAVKPVISSTLEYELSPSSGSDLMDFCCFHIFNHLQQQKPAKRCKDIVNCGKWFAAEHQREEFCSERCGNRFRKERQRKGAR
jgi:predicted nucleic acid-binding Zn ribbon protein